MPCTKHYATEKTNRNKRCNCSSVPSERFEQKQTLTNRYNYLKEFIWDAWSFLLFWGKCLKLVNDTAEKQWTWYCYCALFTTAWKTLYDSTKRHASCLFVRIKRIWYVWLCNECVLTYNDITSLLSLIKQNYHIRFTSLVYSWCVDKLL